MRPEKWEKLEKYLLIKGKISGELCVLPAGTVSNDLPKWWEILMESDDEGLLFTMVRLSLEGKKGETK
jgi:hypothetical protein